MNPVEACQSTAAETGLPKEKIIPSTISARCPDTDDLIQKINRGTQKQIKIFHVGNRLLPDNEFSVEIPTLVEVRNQNSSAEMRPLNDIFRDFGTGVIHFWGPAGSGKTTLLKEISRRVYEKEFESLLGVEVVLFLRCADINTEKESSPIKLLLSHLEPEPSNDEMKLFHTILSTAPEKVLILLDGLDTLPEYFLLKSNSHTESEIQNYRIITDLLDGQLYQQCRIITSAREVNLQHLKARPRSSVFLMGLRDESIFKISRQFLDFTDVNSMMTTLHGQQELMDLCRTPMFLISVLIARKKDNQFRNISSITDSLLNLMNGFIEDQESLMEVTDKVNLKRLAFNLLERNRFNFSKQTLDENGLNPKKIESLIFYSPNGRNRVVFFVHQFIHEALAALHLVGLKENRFKVKLKKCIDLPSFQLAILMVCRIVCSNDTLDLAKKDDLLQLDHGLINKRKILLQLVRKRLVNLRNRNNGVFDLWTLLALHECGKFAIQIINEELNHVHLRLSPSVQLSISHLFAVMSVATKSEKLTTLALQQCGLNPFHLKVIHRMIINATPVQIDNLNFSFNDNLNAEAMGLVGDIARLCRAKELNVSGCSGLLSDSPDAALFSLKKTLDKHKLEVLDVSYNMQCLNESKMTEDTMKKTIDVSYKRAVDRRDQGDPLPDMITGNYTVNGEWNEASYDFVRSVLKLTESVTKRIVLRCWKFTKERRDMMRNCPNACPDLKLELYDDDILIPKSVDNGAMKSKSRENIPTSDLKNEIDQCVNRISPEPPEKLSKTWTDRTEVSHVSDDSISGRIEKMNSDDNYVPDKKTSHQAILLDRGEVENLSGVYHRTMNGVDVQNIVNDLMRKSHIYELEFRQCGLNENLVKMLINRIRGLEIPVEIKKLSVTAHDDIEKLLPVIFELMKVCGSTELNLEESTGSDDVLIILNQLIKRHEVKLQKLDLSYRENINFGQLGTIITSGLTDLSLVNCYLQPEDFAAMQVKNSKLQYLDISYNQIDEECIEALPGLFCKDKPVTLVMKGCDLTADEISALESLGNIEVQHLDLSYNTDLGPEGLKEIGRFARKRSTKTVRLSACELDGDSLTSLRNGLENHQLHSLDLSRNTGISSCHTKVTEILRESRVEEFNLSNCKMLSAQIRNLGEAMGKQCTSVKTVDLSDSDRKQVDQEYVDSIKNFLGYNPECRPVKLILPHLDDGDKKSLRQQLP